jgi:hypothetical protein
MADVLPCVSLRMFRTPLVRFDFLTQLVRLVGELVLDPACIHPSDTPSWIHGGGSKWGSGRTC